MRHKKVDSFFLFLVVVMVLLGFFIFSSAAMGQLTKDGAGFLAVVSKQLAILAGGLLAMIVFSSIDYKKYRKIALPMFVVAAGLSCAVLIPGLALEAGGAKRWIDLGILTFQPAEFLKFATIIYLAGWLATRKDKIKDFSAGFIPFICLIAILTIILAVIQRDNGTFLVACITSMIMFFAAGGKIKHLALLGLAAVIAISFLAYTRPYIRERITTYINPSHDVRGASWQINQSLIAIGSGGMAGRGFGQSLQKFNFLPEPIGDSIFAVASEEFGFTGSTIIIAFFLIFALWGIKITTRITDPFGRFLALGLVCMVFIQASINIGAMIGILPLTGVPLLFISHGGTALLFVLIEMGIILNISKQRT
ncbi:MAG: putative peptidoglycan glycosyltransferase FtsW [Candidatus Paceibacterota bacterium]|jgi:cell division protein FtsW